MFSKIAIAATALAGAAYATTGETVTATGLAVTAVNANDGSGAGTDAYTMYSGDGSAGSGWPDQSTWVSYSDMFENNKPFMQAHCGNLGWGDNDSDAEIQAIQDAIDTVATATFVDHRFILAVIMQESGGCVRAPTSVYSVSNPGLMQDHSGASTCNPGSSGSAQSISPCPDDQISGMISDGTAGTDAGDGLANCLNQATGTGSQAFYEAARIYNSGSVDPSGDLGAGVATHCYASDIANRLTGWVNAAHGCTLDG
ncbi:hypothetical protein BGW36DRAFT_438298 [Talaromyces proteolyticus]|uniref:Transglycosylase SLT domain-containing protein n=1 Tax=Talaromyces proteolyticus TaxID=1131652 RepID=A0AAD4KHI6_9EURO|nr:uncharacterized protein BGW36DRAFT_438298 [Talaromyces proteolyticus]KAH8692284.1 hypothetical protein BGW36DRAFT_438298 [Talaromyces proteolyticus]